MKNISLTINPNAITSFAPSPMPMPSALPSVPPVKTISVSFSAQFDDEEAALKFAKSMLTRLHEYKMENT